MPACKQGIFLNKNGFTAVSSNLALLWLRPVITCRLAGFSIHLIHFYSLCAVALAGDHREKQEEIFCVYISRDADMEPRFYVVDLECISTRRHCRLSCQQPDHVFTVAWIPGRKKMVGRNMELSRSRSILDDLRIYSSHRLGTELALAHIRQCICHTYRMDTVV